MSELYRNFGTAALNDTPCPDNTTIIVTGVARSGTSMVASSLVSLGLPMGDKIDDSVFEDIQVAKVLDDRKAMADLIARKNAAHAKWGFKRPMAFDNISANLDLFRNPRIVVTFRDAASIAMRNVISMRFEFLPALGLATAHNAQLTKFVTAIAVPTLVISYEKALTEPEQYARELCSFCGIDAPIETRSAVADMVQSGPPRYLEMARRKD